MIDREPSQTEVDNVIADYERDLRRDKRMQKLRRFVIVMFSAYDFGSPSAIQLLDDPDI